MTLVLVHNAQLQGYEEAHEINHDFTSTRLIVEISSSEAELFQWIRAGFLIEKVTVEGITARTYKQRLNFAITAVVIAPFQIPYRLIFKPHDWIRDAIIKIWEVQ